MASGRCTSHKSHSSEPKTKISKGSKDQKKGGFHYSNTKTQKLHILMVTNSMYHGTCIGNSITESDKFSQISETIQTKETPKMHLTIWPQLQDWDHFKAKCEASFIIVVLGLPIRATDESEELITLIKNTIGNTHLLNRSLLLLCHGGQVKQPKTFIQNEIIRSKEGSGFMGIFCGCFDEKRRRVVNIKRNEEMQNIHELWDTLPRDCVTIKYARNSPKTLALNLWNHFM